MERVSPRPTTIEWAPGHRFERYEIVEEIVADVTVGAPTHRWEFVAATPSLVRTPTGIRAVQALGGPNAAGMVWDSIEAKRSA